MLTSKEICILLLDEDIFKASDRHKLYDKAILMNLTLPKIGVQIKTLRLYDQVINLQPPTKLQKYFPRIDVVDVDVKTIDAYLLSEVLGRTRSLKTILN